MSTVPIKAEVFSFLGSPTPEVLCIRGKWGVGKTYSWKHYLNEAIETNVMTLKRYAYVSLFGINSLDELKYSLFQSTLNRDQIAGGVSLATLKDTLESAEGLGRKYSWILNLIPGAKTYMSAAAPALFLSVQNQIICIDDLERKGKNLNAGDVLGLTSFLREERACKVVLLLNDEALDDEDRQQFEGYLEKVVDVSLRFDPSAQESLAIAITGSDDISRRIVDHCQDLDISNIRVIKKIERSIRAVQPILTGFDEGVLNQATLSLTLFVWSYYQPSSAPTPEFLTTKRTSDLYGGTKSKTDSPIEAAWHALLDTYKFGWCDAFDLVLMEGVKIGYFQPEA